MLGSSVASDALGIALRHAPPQQLLTRVALTRASRSLASYQFGDGAIETIAQRPLLSRSAVRAAAAATPRFQNPATHGRHSWAQPQQHSVHHQAAPYYASDGGAACRSATATVGAMVEQPLVVNPRPATLRALYMQLKLNYESGTAPSAEACNRVLSACTGRERWPDVWACYRLAESLGVQLWRETYTGLCQRAIEAGWLSHAAELLRRCGAVWGLPDQRTYVTVISRLLKQRRKRGLPAAQLAYQLWRELSDACHASLDGASVRTGVAACVAVGRLEEAERLLAWAREAGVRAGHGAYNRLLTYYTERGDMAAALQSLKTMRARGYEPDGVTWNTMIWGYARVGETVRARAMLDKARRMGCEPDAWAWSALLHGYARKGEMTNAESALAEMRRLQAQQHERYCNALGAHQAAQASSSGSNHSHNGNGLHAQHRRPPPTAPAPLLSAHAYGALVDGYMRMGAASAAEAAASRMQSEAGLPPNRIVYNTLLRGYCKLGMAGQARALELLGEMRAAGVRPGPDTYTTLLAAAAELPGADQLVAMIHGEGATAAEDGMEVGSGDAEADASAVGQQGAEWPAGMQQQAQQLRARVRAQQEHEQQVQRRAAAGAAAATANGVVQAAQLNGNGATAAPSAASTNGASAPAGSILSKPAPRAQRSASPDSTPLQLRSPVRALNGAPPATPPAMPSTAGFGGYVRGGDGDGASQRHPPGMNMNGSSGAELNANGSHYSSNGNGSVPAPDAVADPGRPSLAAVAGEAAALISSLHAGGSVPDGALLTALMMLHARAGRHALALRVFQELSASPHARADMAAWSALAAVHVARGAMADAEAAAGQAAAQAAAQGRGAPEEAFGAVVQGYASAGDVGRMLQQYKRFLVLGGRPPRRMLDIVVDTCLRRGEMTSAMKALRAAELTGARVTRERYQAWFKRWEVWHERRGSSTDGGSRSLDQGDGRQPPADGVTQGFERFKWWLGLPNSYYSPEWKEGSWGKDTGQSQRGRADMR